MISKFFKKVKNIADAFSHPLPVEEAWYKERLASCESCEFNSDNVKPEDKSWIHSVRDVANPCPEKRHCTVCGCCIDRKAAVPAESCGLKGSLKHTQAGYAPKWESLVFADHTNKGLFVLKPENQTYTISKEGGTFVINLGETSDKTIEFKVEISTPEHYSLKNFVAGCGCTYLELQSLGKGQYIFPIKLSTNTFQKGIPVSKFVSIYFMDGNIQRVVNLKLNTKLV